MSGIGSDDDSAVVDLPQPEHPRAPASAQRPVVRDDGKAAVALLSGGRSLGRSTFDAYLDVDVGAGASMRFAADDFEPLNDGRAARLRFPSLKASGLHEKRHTIVLEHVDDEWSTGPNPSCNDGPHSYPVAKVEILPAKPDPGFAMKFLSPRIALKKDSSEGSVLLWLEIKEQGLQPQVSIAPTSTVEPTPAGTFAPDPQRPLSFKATGNCQVVLKFTNLKAGDVVIVTGEGKTGADGKRIAHDELRIPVE